MKKIIINLFALLLVLSACSSRKDVQLTDNYKERQYRAGRRHGPVKKVGIVNFTNKALWGTERLGKACTDVLITELYRYGNFQIVEMGYLGKIDAANTSPSQIQQNIIALGRKYGVKHVITGSVSQYSYRTYGGNYVVYKDKIQEAEAGVDIRLFNTKTGLIVYADSGHGKIKRKIGKVLGVGPNAGYDESLGQDAMRSAIGHFINKLAARL